MDGNYDHPLQEKMNKDAIAIEKKAQALSPNEKLGYYADTLTRDEVVRLHSRLAKLIANKYKNNNYQFEDLFPIAMIGLLKAYDSFNPQFNIKFTSYASRCMENEILMFYRKERKEKNSVSLEESLGRDKNGKEVILSNIISSPKDNVEDKVETKLMVDYVLKSFRLVLNKREIEILIRRTGLVGEKETQREIARSLGISKSSVTRIEGGAIKKLSKKVYGKLKEKVKINNSAYEEQKPKLNLNNINPTMAERFLERYIYAGQIPPEGIISLEKFIKLLGGLPKDEVYILVQVHGLIDQKEKQITHIANLEKLNTHQIHAIRRKCVNQLQNLLGLEERCVKYQHEKDIEVNQSKPVNLSGDIKSYHVSPDNLKKYFETLGAVELKPTGDVRILTPSENVEPYLKWKKATRGKQTIEENQQNDKMQDMWVNVERMKRIANKPVSISEFQILSEEASKLGILNDCMGQLIGEERSAVMHFLRKQKSTGKINDDIVSQMSTYWWLRSAAQKFRDIKDGIPIMPIMKEKESGSNDQSHKIIQILKKEGKVHEYLSRLLSKTETKVIELTYGLTDSNSKHPFDVALELNTSLQAVNFHASRGMDKLNKALHINL